MSELVNTLWHVTAIGVSHWPAVVRTYTIYSTKRRADRSTNNGAVIPSEDITQKYGFPSSATRNNSAAPERYMSNVNICEI